MNKQAKADIILSSNAVFTGLAEQPIEAAIAIIDNKIAAVGSWEDMQPLIGDETKVYTFTDKLIMPGFHDFHLHVMSGCFAEDNVYLFDARSEEEAVELVRAHAESRPDDRYVIGFSWDSAYWEGQKMPHRSSLDRVIPDRPVILFHAEGHYAWVNSKTLELFQIDPDTENPPFGIIEKDEHGQLTGILYEDAMSLVTGDLYDMSEEKRRQMFQRFLQNAARLGVTSVNDLYSEGNSKLVKYELYREFEERDELTVRIHFHPVLDGNLEQAKQLRETYHSDKLQLSGLKQFIDGVITGYTAYMVEPYADKPDSVGDTCFPAETIKKWVVEADKEGFRVRFHAIGDGAIRLALDAYEAAQKENGIRDSRHTIEHVEVIHPDDIARFQQLGVIASMQPNHFALSEREGYTAKIGTEREKYVFVINTLKASGAKLAFGTDYPIDKLNPLSQIHRAVTRIDSGGNDVWLPEERITLAEALKAYTLGSAYGTFREHELGTIEVGKLADLIVLDRNLFAVPAEGILQTTVDLTIADGKVVFEK
ncbi:MAG: amidohydrolase [Clostridia bacterium]